MKYILGCVVLMLIAEGGICEDKVRVSFAKSGNGWVEYAVPAEKFVANENAWNPSLGKFPADLSDYVRKAKKVLLKKNKGLHDAEVSSIEIKQVTKPLQWPDWGKETLVERTVLSFHFEQKSGAEIIRPHPILMLLDGTVAEARLTDRLAD